MTEIMKKQKKMLTLHRSALNSPGLLKIIDRNSCQNKLNLFGKHYCSMIPGTPGCEDG